MKRLFVDLEICSKCQECSAYCSYFYHPQNDGISSLREYAAFATVCRQCDKAPCVNSCYHSALEKQPDGLLKRYTMRCSSCKSCSVACPFGTIFPEFIPYLSSRCDYCITEDNKKIPACIKSCPHTAVELKEIEENHRENIFFVGGHLAVRSVKWNRKDPLIDKL